MKPGTQFCLLALVFHSAVTFAADGGAIPRTATGQPDMQGVWFYGTATPMERPEGLGMQQTYDAEEADALFVGLSEQERARAAFLDPARSAPTAGANIAQEADHNFADMRSNFVTINGEIRTSQIVEPENGRFPFRQNYQDFFQALEAKGFGSFDGPEIRPASERCVGPNGGPMAPLVSWFYNANMQIYQTHNYVVLLSEMNHDARIVALVDPSRLESELLKRAKFPMWMGTSLGYWDGDVLVVETAGFRAEQSWFAFPMSEQLRISERFELINSEEILYRYQVQDPLVYSEPFTVERNIHRRQTGEPIYEYSCHEGNYSLPSILAGARRQDLDIELGN